MEYLNNKYFQGIMGPVWYTDIDTWMDKYGFDEQVMINLFDYCYSKSALHKNYVQVVAESWGLNKVKNLDDLEKYYREQEKLMKMKKEIAKKYGVSRSCVTMINIGENNRQSDLAYPLRK